MIATALRTGFFGSFLLAASFLHAAETAIDEVRLSLIHI
jgi:hypothetical protein